MSADGRPEDAWTMSVERIVAVSPVEDPDPVGGPVPADRSIDTDTSEEHHSDMDLLAPKCYRHDWHSHPTPCYGVEGSDIEIPANVVHCRACFRVRDEAIRRRNRGNKNRGGAFERSIATKLGARRTGPLGGRDDVLGETVAVQTKKTINFSVRQARTYLDDLSRTYPTRTALVIHAEPGRDREAVVVLRLADWLSLHGPDGMEKSA